MTADDRIADALADLADTLAGFRTLADKAIADTEREQAEEAERDRRQDPIEWERALRDLHEWLYRHKHGYGPTGDDEKQADPDVDRLVEAIDAELRGSNYGLRYALRTLAGKSPEDLRAEAEQHARGEALDDLERAVYVRAYLEGATRGG